MANLPEGISTLGPVYLPTKTKDLYVKACEQDGILMSDGVKKDVIARIQKHFPGFTG